MTQQTTDRETSWTIIDGAANGSVEARERFVELYTPALEAYLRKRWQQSTYIDSVDDAVQEVFLECFKHDGILSRAERDRHGGFRAFFYGVVRNTALRFERKHNQDRAHCPTNSLDPDGVHSEDPTLSQVFDKAWARSIVQEAVLLHRERARSFGWRQMLRVEILRLRFEEGLPIREIAQRLHLPSDLAHKEYAKARKAYHEVLKDVVTAHNPSGTGDVDEQCRQVLRLLG